MEGQFVKVLLADDHAIMREGLRAILDKRADVTVVAEAADGHEAVGLAKSMKPEVVVMDVTMPNLNGVEATRQIMAASPDTKVIGLSMNSDPRYVIAMFSAGASGYILKNAASEELMRAIDAVLEGQKYVSPLVGEVVVTSAVESSRLRLVEKTELSAREREVLQLLAEGATSKEIATRLGVATSTVESHRRQIAEKLGLRSVAELTKYAIREGLTSVDR
jgi:DNA-binding NarL/FixJ family response regulator